MAAVDLNPSSLSGRRVTLMGLGRHGGGLGAARFLLREGARLTITDLADEHSLAESVSQLAGAPVERYCLGRHEPEDFATAEIVVVNPAVKPHHPLLELARQNGARICSEIEFFLERCSGTVIGVTGTVGKSSTATLIAEMLQCATGQTYLGGNLGGSLLDEVARIRSADWVVLELSSFQLAQLKEQVRWPAVAVVTNCRPNHLDWHGTYAEYMAAKQRLVTHARQGVVLSPWDDEVSSWGSLAKCPALPVLDPASLPVMQVPGEHMRHNAALAATVARWAGAPEAAINSAILRFSALPHRFALVKNVGGRAIYNDSKATTPEATLAALEAVPEPAWLLLGGSDKGADFAQLASAIRRRAAGVAVYGAVREQLAAILSKAAPTLPIHVCEHLPEALDWCWKQSRTGDAIVLSPACASLDQYTDYRERGERFIALVNALSERIDGQ